MTTKIDELNRQITEAIFEVEKANEKLSQLEEQLASLTSPASIEGKIARRGAVRTAMVSRNRFRAIELVERYCAEKETDNKLKIELKNLITLE